MHRKSAKEIHEIFMSGQASAEEITRYFLDRIANHDDTVKSFITVFEKRAIEQAKKVDAKKAKGEPLGPLAGVPIALKDNIQLKGEKTTCASKFLENYTATYDATVCRLLEEADSIFLGKTNLDEFAMGASTEKSAFFPTKNPWDLDCVPGGSSGGAAAAVAARLAPISLGSDTGGSIRQPAAFCGVVGFKPTYGRVSRYGLVAFGSSLDQIGPLAGCVEDVALAMEVMGKKCEMDSTTLSKETGPYFPGIYQPIKGKKVGVPWKFLSNLEPEIAKNFKEAINTLEKLGCEICEVDLDLLENSIAVYYILATAEASTNLARFDGIRYGKRSESAKTIDEVFYRSRHDYFGPEVKRRILLGTYVLSSGHLDAFYKKAQKVRTLFIQQFAKAFTHCDTIVIPTAPSSAFKMDGIQDPLQMYLQDIYTISPNLAGLPAVSVPSGFTEENHPLGIQFIGPQREEIRILNFAYHFEQEVKYSFQIPALFGGEDE